MALAVSRHAPTDGLRDRLVPITDGTTAQENQTVHVGTQFRF